MDEIRFGTDGWRTTLDEFTVPRVRMVGQAVASYLDDEGIEGPVAVGYDARESSPEFADEIADVLAASGRDVVVPTRDVPTPVVAWNVADRGFAGAVMVTASHNPPEYNGIKFIPSDGAPALPPVMNGIKERLAEPASDSDDGGQVREENLVEAHANHSMELVDPGPLDGLHVVYDAMHGSGRGVTDALLERAGATVDRIRSEQGFGGMPPEPSEERLEPLVAAVEESGADFGIANDGDADRITVVTPDRGYVDGNLLYAVLYDYLLETKSGPAVRTVSTTFLVDEIATDHGEEVYETKVGFKWIGEAMAEHDALIGGEESDGFTIRGHIRLKDGVLVALLAAAAAADESLDDRLDRIEATYGTVHGDKVSVDCPDSEKERVLDDLADRIPDELAGTPVDKIGTVDGFKIFLDDGAWVLVRPSGTEPKMRIYAEADGPDRVEDLLDAGRELVEPLV